MSPRAQPGTDPPLFGLPGAPAPTAGLFRALPSQLPVPGSGLQLLLGGHCHHDMGAAVERGTPVPEGETGHG